MTDEKTALARREESAPAKAPIRAGSAVLGIIPTDIEQAFRLSTALAQSGDMIPQHYQGSPQKIMAAILRGAEVGLPPMQALASIAVINGRASLWGDALPALVLRAGHMVDVEIHGDGKDAVAVATLTRASGDKIVRRFSMADARHAGLLEKKGPWTQYPQRMLAHRARAWAIRDGAADVLMGLAVADEVIEHQGPEYALDVTPPARPSRRGSLSFHAPEPESPVIEPDETHEPELVNAAPDPANGFPMDPEWTEGAEAFKADTPYGANPYTGQQADSWAGGWQGAQIAASHSEAAE